MKDVAIQAEGHGRGTSIHLEQSAGNHSRVAQSPKRQGREGSGGGGGGVCQQLQYPGSRTPSPPRLKTCLSSPEWCIKNEVGSCFRQSCPDRCLMAGALTSAER